MDIRHKNYFELFSLPESFQIDSEVLIREFKKLQTHFHPDKYINADDTERLRVLQLSSILNEAYNTLKSPLKRAAYLLTVKGFDPEERIQNQLSEDFLLKQMEWRDQLEKIADTDKLDELEKLKDEVGVEQKKCLQDFERLYEKEDYVAARRVYKKLQFMYKLIQEVDLVEEKLLDY